MMHLFWPQNKTMHTFNTKRFPKETIMLTLVLKIVLSDKSANQMWSFIN